MNGEEEVLVSVLALTDAVWLPMRDWDQSRPANTYFARRDFARVGVPWASGAASEAARKETQRQLERLASAWKVRVFKPRGVKTLGVRLTEDGEREVRTLCGLPQVNEALAHLARIVRLCDEANMPWVAEPVLAGVAWGSPGTSKIFARLEDELLPALVRGWVKSGASLQRHVYYQATDEGRKAAEGAPESVPKSQPNYGSEAYGFYFQCLEDALSRLGSAEPRDRREIGIIPLSVSMGGQAVYLSTPEDSESGEAEPQVWA